MNNIITPNFTQVVEPAKQSSVKEMLSVAACPQTGRIVVRVNSSSLSVVQTCARKSFYLLDQKLRSKSGSPALIYGTAVHKALEVFYGHRGERSIPVGFDEHAPLLAHGHEAPEQHFLYDAVKAFVAAAEPLQNLPDTDDRSIASGIWTLTHYFETYINDDYEIYADANGPFVERTFSTPVVEQPDLQIVLFGTIDFALRNRRTGEILVGDHKTTSQLGSQFLNRIKPNHQYTGYVIGAQRALGIGSESFLVNGIQVKRKSLTARGGPPTFTRQITRRTPQDVEEFLEALHWSVRNYLAWKTAGSWPLGHVDACSAYGGCAFLDVCSAPNQLRSNIIEAKFSQE